MVDFGTDVSTFPVFDVTGRTISGVRAVAECSLRRFTTPHGSLEYDPDFGRDMRDLLNDDFDDADLPAEAGAAEAELEKDERVLTANVTLDLDRSASSLTLSAGGTLADGRPFQFVLAIADVSSDILKAS